MKSVLSILKWPARFLLLFVLYTAAFLAGSTAVAGFLPVDVTSEPGLVSDVAGLALVSLSSLALSPPAGGAGSWPSAWPWPGTEPSPF